ncbi:MAG: hypothetical protein ACR2F1_01095 [Nitrososphaeraceae archaeon]
MMFVWRTGFQRCFPKNMVLVPHLIEDFRIGCNQLNLKNYGPDRYKSMITKEGIKWN